MKNNSSYKHSNKSRKRNKKINRWIRVTIIVFIAVILSTVVLKSVDTMSLGTNKDTTVDNKDNVNVIRDDQKELAENNITTNESDNVENTSGNEEKLEDIPEEVRDEFEKAVSLRVIDNYWMEHISTMSHLRDGIGLRGYANTSPLQAYTMEGYQLFDEMIARINKDISIYLLKSEIRQNLERKQVAKNAITNDSKDHAKVQKKSTKVGRNDPCPCGSGKKYKNCCGKNK